MKQRVTVGRFTRETQNALHDLYVMPTGRTYYRRNMGPFENVIPDGPGALVDLRKCLHDNKASAVHHLQGRDLFHSINSVRKLAELHHCSYDVQDMDVDATSL